MFRSAFIVLATIAALVSAVFLGTAAAEGPRSAVDALQQRIDRYLVEMPGSRQISANEVAFPGGVITVNVPGAAASPSSEAGVLKECPYEYLCLVKWNGVEDWDAVSYYHCGTYALPNWVGYGNYQNDQTPGTVARFLDRNYNTLWTSTAFEDRDNVYWTPVWHVRPC